MEAIMKNMQGALARAKENKQRELVEKDKTITELTDVVIR